MNVVLINLPTSGTAMDVAGTISATINWKTLRESKMVIPAEQTREQNYLKLR